MRKTVLFVIFLAVASPALSAEEVIARSEVPYDVTYKNGNRERYVAKYSAIISHDKHESGGPAKPFEGKFVDDRQCHWNISTKITRQVCLTSQSGRQFCEGNLNHIYGTSFANKGSDFVLVGLRSENCGDADARYRSDLNNARNEVRRALDGTASGDASKVMSDMRSQLAAESVRPAR